MLNGKTGALVNKDPAALALSRASARRTPDGGLAADFAVALPPAAASNPAAVDYIVATGPLKPDGASPGFHPWYESGLLSLPPLAPAAPPAAAPAPPACANAAGTPYDACRELAAGVKIYWNASAATKERSQGVGRCTPGCVARCRVMVGSLTRWFLRRRRRGPHGADGRAA